MSMWPVETVVTSPLMPVPNCSTVAGSADEYGRPLRPAAPGSGGAIRGRLGHRGNDVLIRGPKGVYGARPRRCCPAFAAVWRLTASLSAASLASRSARRRVVLAASACLSASSGRTTIVFDVFAFFAILNGSSARQRHHPLRSGGVTTGLPIQWFR